jgi:hypothetical protein
VILKRVIVLQEEYGKHEGFERDNGAGAFLPRNHEECTVWVTEWKKLKVLAQDAGVGKLCS